MGSLGIGELLVIFVIALVVFGPRKLPELGRTLGRSLAEFKRASNELRSTLEAEIRVEEHREQREQRSEPPPATAVPAEAADAVDDPAAAPAADHHTA